MNLKILFMILIYYGILSLVFTLGGSTLSNAGYNTTISLNDSEMTSNEIDTGGLFGTGVSFTRFLGFLLFGVGLPEDTPSFFNVIFILWQTLVTIFTIGFIISSIWDG